MIQKFDLRKVSLKNNYMQPFATEIYLFIIDINKIMKYNEENI